MQVVKIKPVLWTYKKGKHGAFEIRIRVTQYKEITYFNTGFTSSPASGIQLSRKNSV